MQPALQQQEEDLFAEAAALDPGQRDSFLELRCPDHQMRQRLAELLEHDALSGELFLRCGHVAGITRDVPLHAPRKIGGYEILRVLGQGGMATVYEAQQEKPQRKVALKVIRGSFMSAQLQQRFEFEAEVLARLDHPGIARIYESGAADTGMGLQPYFAMELVRGSGLSQYLRQTQPPLRQRLALFAEICHAVNHAHLRGVIHRDLKPANIVITDEGKPKVLDFGVALRVVSGEIQVRAHTESGALIGTLPYMAPEQAAGRVHEIDTSSDVYALGVIAYEMLSGRMPYVLENKPLHEAVRTICEESTTRLSSIDRRLRGDVETILNKAMEKDQARRYRSAGELADDIRRFLTFEPISARRMGTWYQLTRFARRNKLLVSGVGLLLIVLIAGVVGTSIGVIRAQRQRAVAEAANADAHAVIEFLTEDILGADHPRLTHGRELSVRQAVDNSAKQVAVKFKDRPLVEAAVREALASTYHAIGRDDLALTHQQIALERRRALLGDDHPQTMASISNVGYLMQLAGQLADAETLMLEAIERRRRVLGDSHPDTLESINNIGFLRAAQGRLDEAAQWYQAVLRQRRSTLGDDDPNTLLSMNNLGYVLQQQGRLSESQALWSESLARSRRVLGDDDPQTLLAINNMAGLLQFQVKLSDAEPLYQEALDRRMRVLGPIHPDTLQSMHNMGFLRAAQNRLDESEVSYAQTLQQRRSVLGQDHPDTLLTLNNLGAVLEAQNRLADAESLYAELLRRATSAQLDPGQAAVFVCRDGFCLVKLGRWHEAEQALNQACEFLKRARLEAHPAMRLVLEAQVRVYEATEDPDAVARCRAELQALRGSTRPSTDPAHPH